MKLVVLPALQTYIAKVLHDVHSAPLVDQGEVESHGYVSQQQNIQQKMHYRIIKYNKQAAATQSHFVLLFLPYLLKSHHIP